MTRQRALEQAAAAPARPADRALAGVSASAGQPLDRATLAEMEPLFGHDFGRVRVHTHAAAAGAAQAIGARAYTVGHHVAFGAMRHDPASAAGRRLLAHELAHVVQQSVTAAPGPGGRLRTAGAAEERAAEQAAGQVAAGRRAPAPQPVATPALACFSDDTHHVIEEAALGGLFAPEQLHAVERGNIQRDSSQLPPAVNALLLGQRLSFGGYDAAEHFDNFMFDPATDTWRTRGAAPGSFKRMTGGRIDFLPIDYIESQLDSLAQAGANPRSLQWLGNAFHTVEDFFAHSNFIEHIAGAAKSEPLLTGSFVGDAANEQSSLAHVQGGVATPAMKPYYHGMAEAAAARTERYSHARIAKDTADATGFVEARRLAALVIQDLGRDIAALLADPNPLTRSLLMKEVVLPRIRRYLRPPIRAIRGGKR